MDELPANSISTSTMRDLYLNHLNKTSYKIVKPTKTPLPPSFPVAYHSSFIALQSNPTQVDAQSQQQLVYNINKRDFRDVVQKLTGAPAYHQFLTPPPTLPMSQSKPSSSKFHKFRPPPLAQISNRPQNDGGQRAFSPSPLPVLPSVHTPTDPLISSYRKSLPIPEPEQPKTDAAAAYLKFISNSKYAPRPPVVPQPPMWNVVTLTPAPTPTPESTFPMGPLSPLPFGCSSPMSLYGMLSPSLLLSPTSRFGLPLSPLQSPSSN